VQRSNRLAALGELSAGVAHEIRNPLGVIKNSAEMLRDRIQEDSKRRELTGYIVEEVERLDKVITNFLQFARPAEPDFELMGINDVLEHTTRFMEPETHFAGIAVEKDLASDLPQVLIDSQQLHQVFLNLFMNAFQAMNESGTLRVETRLALPDAAGQGSGSNKDQDGTVTVSISDTGEGISPDIRPRIFDPFFSTKDEGIGLGLSMVHKIIENHNGRIRVESEQGSGTTFIISLPIVDAPRAKG
jgi:two-component system sensor histidine kinase HydH